MNTFLAFVRRLANNTLCGIDRNGRGIYTAEGITALCEGLKGSAVTSLTWAAPPCSLPHAMSLPAEHFSFARSLAENRLCGVWTEYGQQHGTYTAEGITALCEGLKGSAVTSLT